MEKLASPLPATGGFLIRTLGDFGLWRTDGSGHPVNLVLGPGKPLALLLYCASSRKRRHTRDALGDLLWSDAPVDRRRMHVRQALWRLRRIVGDAMQVDDQYVLAIDPVIGTDVDRWTDAVAHGRGGSPDDPFPWYQGPFLPDLHFPGGDEFAAWVDRERSRLEPQLLGMAERVLQDALTRDDRVTSRQVALALMERAPSSIPAHRMALRAMQASGDAGIVDRIQGAMSQLAVEQGVAMESPQRLDVQPPDQDNAGRDDLSDGQPLCFPLVGRGAVLTALDAEWRQACSGSFRVCTLFGIAGIGKSRMLDVLADRLRTDGAAVVAVRARPAEATIPFSAIIAIAREIAVLPGAAGVDPSRAADLVAMDATLRTHFPVVPATSPPLDLERQRALAMVDLVEAVCDQQPVAILLDDLHWCDPFSRTLLQVVSERARQASCLLVTTSRGVTPDWGADGSHRAIPLLPIPDAALLDTLRGSGEWPEHPEVAAFQDAVIRDAEGNPQVVAERLMFAMGAGILRREGPRWEADDWSQAVQAVAMASPLDQTLLQGSSDERALLMLFAVAGQPLPYPVLLRALDGAGRENLQGHLEGLSARGLIVREGADWALSHDRSRVRLLALSTAGDRTRSHRALALAWKAEPTLEHSFGEQGGDSPPSNPRLAIRHFVLADAVDDAGRLLATWMRIRLQAGDPTPVSGVLRECLGDDLAPDLTRRLLRQVPWTRRSLRLRRQMQGMLGAMAVIGLAFGGWSLRYPRDLQVPTTPQYLDLAHAFGPDARRFTPPLAVRVGGLKGTESARVRVRIPDSSAALITGDEETTDSNGVATFASLRLTSTRPEIHLRFETDGARPIDVQYPLRSPNDATGQARLHFVAARLGGIAVEGDDGIVVVPPGASLDGYVQLRYRTSWSAASVFVAMIPTWTDGGTAPRDILPVPTPVPMDVVDLPMTLRGPQRPGTYWLLFALAAESSGNFIASGTNWTVGEPVWNDGNDLAALPDSVIDRARRTGVLETALARPDNDRAERGRCAIRRAGTSTRPLRYCPHLVGFTAIRLVVK